MFGTLLQDTDSSCVLHAVTFAELYRVEKENGGVVLEAWHNEADIINAADPDSNNHYRLRTKFPGSRRRLSSRGRRDPS
jgi:hypothetical protein